MGALFFRQPAEGTGEPQRHEFVVERPRVKPAGSVLLSGARLITMKGDEVIARGDVLVTGNRIAAIGPRGSVRAPAGTRTIDVSGKTIMPGFVDAHAHMWAPRGVHLTEVELALEGDMDVRGALGLSDEVRNGYSKIKVDFRIEGNAPEEKLRKIVEQSRARSAVFDVITNGTPVEITVNGV